MAPLEQSADERNPEQIETPRRALPAAVPLPTPGARRKVSAVPRAPRGQLAGRGAQDAADEVRPGLTHSAAECQSRTSAAERPPSRVPTSERPPRAGLRARTSRRAAERRCNTDTTAAGKRQRRRRAPCSARRPQSGRAAAATATTSAGQDRAAPPDTKTKAPPPKNRRVPSSASRATATRPGRSAEYARTRSPPRTPAKRPADVRAGRTTRQPARLQQRPNPIMTHRFGQTADQRQ